MKKTYINNGENTYKLYINVEGLYGEWMLETEGQPETLSALEDAEAAEKIAEIEAIIADPVTPWEECDEDDEEYINEWLSIWGIK